MKLRFTASQAEWLKSVTGSETAQDAVDFFVDCMRKEGIDPSLIMTYISKMMLRALPPGKGE